MSLTFANLIIMFVLFRISPYKQFGLTGNLYSSQHGSSLNAGRLHDEVGPGWVGDGQVVSSIRVDRDVTGQGNALLVDAGPEVEVLDEGGDVDADLSELRS